MELLTQLLQALWAQDFETLANPSMIGMLYFVLFVILFLENGLLPAAFLPGDSLLVLVGVLIAKGAMGYPQTILLLTVAASLGCWVSYIQGRWLGNTRTVQNWLSHLPAHYHQRAHHLFHKHGLSALLIGRFIAFVRTLLPTRSCSLDTSPGYNEAYTSSSTFVDTNHVEEIKELKAQVTFLKKDLEKSHEVMFTLNNVLCGEKNPQMTNMDLDSTPTRRISPKASRRRDKNKSSSLEMCQGCISRLPQKCL